MKRTVAVVTTSRADYAHLYWPLRELAAQPAVDLKVIALGPHLSPEFGHTGDQIERDGFALDARIESALSSDTDVGMAKSIGVAVLGLAEHLGRSRPDVLVLTADRYEMLAPAAVATALRIPLAHIEGGEISEGAIDDAIRNALTKLSHVHFTSTPRARARVIAMGEQPWRVHCAGAPALDHLTRNPLLSREEVEARLGVAIAAPAAVVAYHPVTIARDTTREADALFRALAALPAQVLFCYPNADAGGRALIDRAKAFVAGSARHRLFVNLDPILYWSLLRQVDLVLGNSSSGIMEAASFALPAIDVGMRQRGRERGRNVLDAHADPEAILKQAARALDPDFRQTLRGMANPYGDGASAQRIAAVLATVPLGEALLVKRSDTGDEDGA